MLAGGQVAVLRGVGAVFLGIQKKGRPLPPSFPLPLLHPFEKSGSLKQNVLTPRMHSQPRKRLDASVEQGWSRE